VAREWRHRTLILEGRTGQLPKYGAKVAGENARLVDRTFEAYGTTPCNLPSTKTTTQPMLFLTHKVLLSLGWRYQQSQPIAKVGAFLYCV